MSCHKCCFNPCDRTSLCMEGTYFIRDQYGNLIEYIEPSESLKLLISKVVLKALGIKDASYGSKAK